MYEARGISVLAGGNAILNEVDLTIVPGRLTVLIGPNGAGKSTLLHVMAGDLRPARGSVSVDGEDVATFSPRALAGRRAVLGQSITLTAPFTVVQIVRLGIEGTAHDGVATDLVQRGLSAVGLAAMADRPITQLSGGEQQRAHTARVLVQLWAQAHGGRPLYLFLDEPTAHLDPAHQRSIMRLARDFANGGGGVLSVLHDLNLAATIADEIVIINRGRIIASGAPPEVLTADLLREVYGVTFRIQPDANNGGLSWILPDYN